MSTDHQRDHRHDDFEIPAGFADPAGRTIDHGLLGQYVSAAFDRCTSCQDAMLTLMTEDSVTTARLVELACIAVHEELGGLPASLTDEDASGLSSTEFRQLAGSGIDGANEAMFARCEQMTPTQRRAAANTATDLLIGAIFGSASSMEGDL